MAKHIATAAVVKVSIGSPSGNSVAVFVQRGGLVPEGVPEEQLERLVRQGFIEEIEAEEGEATEPESFSKDDVDAAVKSAVDAKDAELAEARKALEAEKAEIAKERAALDAAAKTPPAKAPAK